MVHVRLKVISRVGLKAFWFLLKGSTRKRGIGSQGKTPDTEGPLINIPSNLHRH